jgi:ribonuclease Z
MTELKSLRTFAFVLLLSLIGGCDGVVNRAIRHELGSLPLAETLGEGIHVVLCGTGTPKATARGQSCTAVIADGQVLLFDAGEGASVRMALMGIAPQSLAAIFITHWHSDHFSGLPQIINTAWIHGRAEPIPVYGPAGVNAPDIHNRRTNRPDLSPQAFKGIPRLVSGSREHIVYRQSGLSVTAFPVNHEPVRPAYGYRIDYKGRHIVISGDTRVTETTAAAATGADILVHEATNMALLQRAILQMREIGLNDMAKHTSDVVKYHADSLALAAMAQQSGVKHLVLTHLIPTIPDNAIMRWLFAQGMRDHFDGKITVGGDGQIISLTEV